MDKRKAVGINLVLGETEGTYPVLLLIKYDSKP